MAVWGGGFSIRPYTLYVQAYATGTVDVPGNRTLCHADMWVHRDAGTGAWYYDSHWGWSLTATGPTGTVLAVSSNWWYDFTQYADLTLWGGDFWVPHAANGTATISVSGGVADDGLLGGASAGGALALATIPRDAAGRYDGATWKPQFVERWTGSAWALQIAERYNGSAWQKVAA